MDYSLANIIDDNMPTKQKIMINALKLFCTKGYSETSIRDIANEVGIAAGSIYGHFPSKEKLLQNMLNDYAEYTKNLFGKIDIAPILTEKPTGEGVSICIMSSVAILTGSVYYANLVHLIHQEQHRNPLFGNFVLIRMQDTKEFVGKIVDYLKGMKVISDEVDSDMWGAFAYSLFHTISSCAAINSAQRASGYFVTDLGPMLRCLFDAMICTYKL